MSEKKHEKPVKGTWPRRCWLLILTEEGNAACKHPGSFSVGEAHRAMVVVASSQRMARAFASQGAGDEGSGVWLDPRGSSCEEVLPGKRTGIIVQGVPVTTASA